MSDLYPPIFKPGKSKISPGLRFFRNIQNDSRVCCYIIDGVIINCLYDLARFDMAYDKRLYYGPRPSIFSGITKENIMLITPYLDKILSEYNNKGSIIKYVKCEGNRITCVMKNCVIRLITNESYQSKIKLFTDLETKPNFLEEFLFHSKISDNMAVLVSKKIKPVYKGLNLLKKQFQSKRQQILLDVIQGLEWLHDKGFVHTDATLDNIGWDIDRKQFILYDIHDSLPIIKETREETTRYDIEKLYHSIDNYVR